MKGPRLTKYKYRSRLVYSGTRERGGGNGKWMSNGMGILSEVIKCSKIR